MYRDRTEARRLFGSLLLASAVACFAATACSDVTPESNDTGGGVLDSSTHETQQEQQMQGSSRRKTNGWAEVVVEAEAVAGSTPSGPRGGVASPQVRTLGT
jgi:hypothetical protein